jgi:hypothetical protein
MKLRSSYYYPGFRSRHWRKVKAFTTVYVSSAKAEIFANHGFAKRARLEYFDHDSVRRAEHEIAASANLKLNSETQLAYSAPAFIAVFFTAGFFGACWPDALFSQATKAVSAGSSAMRCSYSSTNCRRVGRTVG